MKEGHMINNSNWYRWDRLAAKSFDQQFVNEIIHGLNCSAFLGGCNLSDLPAGTPGRLSFFRPN
jgi:hypothetical protein